MAIEPKVKAWIYPVKPCPRCHSHNTEATHTDGDRGIQYRKCRVAICRTPFFVRGIPSQENQTSNTCPPSGEIKDLSAEGRDQKSELKCPHCDKTYRTQGALTKHLNRHHHS